MRFEEKMKLINASFKLSQEENERFEKLCEHYRMKKSELVRFLIEKEYNELNK